MTSDCRLLANPGWAPGGTSGHPSLYKPTAGVPEPAGKRWPGRSRAPLPTRREAGSPSGLCAELHPCNARFPNCTEDHSGSATKVQAQRSPG
jgi:hypothetical protein